MPVAQYVVASNRGPAESTRATDGRLIDRPGSGGLVSIVAPALAAHGGTWIAGTPCEAGAQAGPSERRVPTQDGPVTTRTLAVDAPTYAGFYRDISTETLWFLHHDLFDLSRRPSFDAGFETAWRAYAAVNEAFAAECAESAATGAAVVLMDYHLALAPAMLRTRGTGAAIAHVTLSPWADPRLFAMLPARYARPLLDGMLGADMVVFVGSRWALNFAACCADLGFDVAPDGRSVTAGDSRRVAVRVLAVGVDPAALRRRLATPDARAFSDTLTGLVGDRQLIVRADRLEPAKNILRGLRGFAEFLQDDPAASGSVVHYVLAYGSRSSLPEYQRYAADVAAMVEEVNGRFGTGDWQPVLFDTANDHPRGLAAMARADLLVVNPLWDGMNLIAKEGPAVNERDAALILSRNCGAADDLGDAAILVDPLDVTALADAIRLGLAMPAEERRRRAGRLQAAAAALPPRQWFARLVAELKRAHASAGR